MPVKPTVVIAPDSFKGCFSAPRAAALMGEGILEVQPGAQIVSCPLADGGEGTLEVVARARGGEWISAPACDALGRAITARYLGLATREGRLALIEASSVIGWCDAPGDPWDRHSGGLGLLIRHAMARGFGEIVVALGGTSTVDGGAGLLASLGFGFYDAHGHVLPPSPAGLRRLAKVHPGPGWDGPGRLPLIGWRDVDNPLWGPAGGFAVYGPQKGVAPSAVAELEAVMGHYRTLLARALGVAPDDRPGDGAAGGLGMAIGLLGSLRAGAGAVAEMVGWREVIALAGAVVTGEGRADLQTLRGKLPLWVAREARGRGLPVSLLAGEIAPEAHDALALHFDTLLSVTEIARAGGGDPRTAALLKEAGRELARRGFVP